MKKLIVLLASVFIMHQANAQQSFQRGSLVTSLDFDWDVYYLTQHYSEYNVPNSETTKTGGAASHNYYLSGEFGVTNWLGLGLMFKLDNYYTGKDSSGQTGPVATAAGFEVAIVGNIHIVRNPHFGLFAGIDLGYSHLTYNVNDGFNDQVYGDGSWFDFHATMQYYFGRFGINFSLYTPVVNYASLTSNNSGWGLGESVLASWKATGLGLNLGIQYRIIN